MPRSTRAPQLETRTARLKLPIAKKPIWARIGHGVAIGYRRNQTAGTWSIRVAKGGRGLGHWTQVIGTADDYDEADGGAIFTFWQAQDKARVLGLAARHGSDAGKLGTVAEALDAYESDLKARGGDAGNVGRVRHHLPAALVAKTVATLAVRDFKPWRAALTKAGLTPAAINRTSTVLKAALNHAAANDERITLRAWETGLKALPDAVASRNVILDESTVRAIVAAAYQVGAEFGLLVELAAVTGARPVQLARLEVRDLQAARADPRLMMPSSKKGRGQKKVARSPVPIPPSLAVRLLAHAQGRAPEASLLVKVSGEPWHRSNHIERFQRALKLAQVDPAITIYALRHSSIVRQLLAGTPIRLVAVAHDTSVAMIERTYSHHIADVSDVPLRRALLDLAEPVGDNVVPLGRSS